MHSNKKLTRFLSIIMAIAVCFSLSATAFAAEEMPDLDEENMVVIGVDETGSVEVIDSTTDESIDFGGTPLRGTHNVYICPPSGSTLKLMISNSITSDTSSIKVETTKNGGWWPSNTTNVPRGQSTTTYTLIDSCNGETYTVKFSADNGYFVAFLYWI